MVYSNEWITIYPKTFLDFYRDIKSKKIVPITNENDDIIGFNVVKDIPSTMKVCKMINNILTVGDTEQERHDDETKMRIFLEEYRNKPLQQWFTAATNFINNCIVIDEIIDKNGEIYAISSFERKVFNLNGTVVVDLCNNHNIDNYSKESIIKLLKSTFDLYY